MVETHRPAPILWKTFVATTAIVLSGLIGLWHVTAGGSAFTTETLRRSEVERASRAIPDLAVLDAQGRSTRLPDLLAEGPRTVIVEFVYTRCQTVCLALGSAFAQLQQQIVQQGAHPRIGLVSISFDPVHDDPAALRDYARRMGMDPAVWRVATLARREDRRALLDAFGIIVIPAPLGEFEHNAALHVVRDGRLVQILDLSQTSQVLDLHGAAAP